MSRERIGIFGASGFVGSALCERLHASGEFDYVAFVRGTGNAARVARLGASIRIVDLLNAAAVREAVQECGTVVNCVLGNDAAMTKGLSHLLDALRPSPKKLIHLSSISIYGEDPAPDSVSETAPPRPGANPYGRIKLQQDNMVMSLAGYGRPVYILCPGNIVGPYSVFSRGLAERLKRGKLPLVDGGRYPSNLIHVDNLVEAILAGVRSENGEPGRYFVNETEPVSWLRVFTDLAAGLNYAGACGEEVPREAVLPYLTGAQSGPGWKDNLRALVSADLRRGLTAVPVLASLNRWAADRYESLEPETQMKIKAKLRWPVRIAKPAKGPQLDERYVKVQVRRYYHSTAKLQKSLAWKAPLNYEKGTHVTLEWLRFAGLGAERWPR